MFIDINILAFISMPCFTIKVLGFQSVRQPTGGHMVLCLDIRTPYAGTYKEAMAEEEEDIIAHQI
jgi:hypothetical protein